MEPARRRSDSRRLWVLRGGLSGLLQTWASSARDQNSHAAPGGVSNDFCSGLRNVTGVPCARKVAPVTPAARALTRRRAHFHRILVRPAPIVCSLSDISAPGLILTIPMAPAYTGIALILRTLHRVAVHHCRYRAGHAFWRGQRVSRPVCKIAFPCPRFGVVPRKARPHCGPPGCA